MDGIQDNFERIVDKLASENIQNVWNVLKVSK